MDNKKRLSSIVCDKTWCSDLVPSAGVAEVVCERCSPSEGKSAICRF
ncbi:MAG: hypothetical protein GX187_09015 [Clostridiaceae bacterium]|nr:hypothetical protein [Clostridiaceae bacterium]